MKTSRGRSRDFPLDTRSLSPPVPHNVDADHIGTLHAAAGRYADNPADGLLDDPAGNPTDDSVANPADGPTEDTVVNPVGDPADTGVNTGTRVAGHALFPRTGCDLCGLLITLPKGWRIPGRGLLSADDLPADFPVTADDLRSCVTDALSGPEPPAPFPCMHAAAELAGTTQTGHRHVTLQFDPTLPAATDGLLHFSFPPDCRIDYTPATGKADFRLTLIPPGDGGCARILFHSFAAPAPDRHTGIREQSCLSHGAFLDVYATASAGGNNDAAGTARTNLRTEILDEDSPAEKGARADDAARARCNPAAGLDFPPLVKGDKVTRLRFRAPDPDKGRISYRGTPVDADADGVVDVGGEDFDPARISFSPAGHWTGTVRLTFVAAIKNFFTKEEREAAGSVCFTVAAPPPARNGVLESIRAGAHGNTRDDAHASIRSRHRPQGGSTPTDKSRTACPLPEERGYRQGTSGSAGRQTGISPTGELAGREGNFDESARVSRVCRPGGAARCDSCLQGGNEEVIRTVPRGGTLHGHFPFAAVGAPGGVLFAAVSVGDEDAVKVGAEGVVRRGRFGVLRVADDGEFVYEADGDGAEPVWECFTWSLYGVDGRMEKGRLYIAVAGY